MNRPERPPIALAPSPTRLAAEVSLVGLFVLALLVALHEAASLVVPMIAAVVFGSVIAHVGDRAQRFGLPPLVGGMALVVASGFGLFFLVDAAAEAVSGLGDRLPDMIHRVEALFGRLIEPLVTLRTRIVGSGSVLGDAGAGAGLDRIASSIDLGAITGVLGGLTPALGEIAIFFLTLCFFVAGRASLRRRAILAFADRDRRLSAIRVMNAGEAALASYFGTTSIVYLGVGLTTAVLAWAGGLTNPTLWGILTFLVSFVPFLGAALVTFALLAAGLLVHEAPLAAIWPAAAFLGVHLVAENAIVPAFLGRRFEINPFLVFVAIVFGTWMWGALGAVLAMPLVLLARTLIEELRNDPRPSLPD